MSIKVSLFIYALFFILIMNSHSIQSQTGKVEGHVFEPTGEPVSNLHVMLTNAKFADVTDEHGYFIIENIPPGIYNIKFNHIGFKTRIIENIKIQKDQVLNLNKIVLQPQILQLNELVVTATRTNRNIYDVSQSINIVSETKIKERDVKTSAEALREETGIFVQKTNHGGGSAIIRGLSSNQILILVDGIRLNNSIYRLGNHQYLTTVDNHMVQQIEVVRGPTSVLYGSDALGGTINLITEQPLFQSANFNLDYKIFGRYASADREKTTRTEVSFHNNKLALKSGFSYKSYGDLRRGRNSYYPQIEKSTNGFIQSPS